jgi:secondary thiamine-phosphate synthase enzyme
MMVVFMAHTEFTVKTSEKRQIVDITDKVAPLVKGVKDALCTIYIPHTSAAVIINEHEPNLEKDFLDIFEKLVPKAAWRHNKIDNNAEAHLKSSIAGISTSIPVIDGALALGNWQKIMLCEFDGPRTRRVIVMVR